MNSKLILEIETAYKHARPNCDIYTDSYGNRRYKCCDNLFHTGHDVVSCCLIRWEELGKKVRELKNESEKA